MKLNEKAPIYRKNTYLGLISLDRIQYDTSLSDREKVELLDNAVYNLNGNGPALLMVALYYFSFGNDIVATNLLLSILDDHRTTCKDEVVITLIKYLDKYIHNDGLFSNVVNSVNNAKGVDLRSIIDFSLMASKEKGQIVVLPVIKDIRLEDIVVGGRRVSQFTLSLPDCVLNNPADFDVFSEKPSKNHRKLFIRHGVLKVNNLIKKKELFKLKYFKENPEQIGYLFQEVLPDFYAFRSNLDLTNIDTGAGLPRPIYDGLIANKKNHEFENFEYLQKLWYRQKSFPKVIKGKIGSNCFGRFCYKRRPQCELIPEDLDFIIKGRKNLIPYHSFYDMNSDCVCEIKLLIDSDKPYIIAYTMKQGGNVQMKSIAHGEDYLYVGNE